jgi:hypothetical protein
VDGRNDPSSIMGRKWLTALPVAGAMAKMIVQVPLGVNGFLLYELLARWPK